MAHLSDSHIDYRAASKRDLIENFTYKNLETIARTENEKTKSVILAPFNSSMEDSGSSQFEDIPRLNFALKFDPQVRGLNRNYELNNNGEIDNGIVISPKVLSKENSLNSGDFPRSKFNSKLASRVGSNFNSPRGERQLDRRNISKLVLFRREGAL